MIDYLFPILAAIFQSGSFTLDKYILSIRNVDFKTYTGISFPLVFIITFLIYAIFRPEISFALFSGYFGLLIILSIILTLITNLIFYRALDNDKLSEIQMLQLLQNIPVIILTGIIFSDERKISTIILALIATISIAWSHWEHGKFKIAKFTLPFLIWIIIIAPAGALLSKILLTVWNPISLELVRSGIIALLFIPLFFKDIKHISTKTGCLLLLTNIFTSVAWILYYFSYQKSGIIFTILLFSIQPLLVYFASIKFLKEKLHWKKATAFIIILISIITCQIINK